MNIDKNLIYFDDVAITKQVDSNVIDMGSIGEEVPFPCVTSDLMLTAMVTEDFNNCDSLTINFASGSSDSCSEVLDSETVALAGLKQGKQFPFKVLPNGVKEFSKLTAIPNGDTKPTKGKLFAALTMSQGQNLGY